MLRMTRQADYAIVLLSYFAHHRNVGYAASNLAGKVHLPLPIVSKILKALAREGLIESQRGVHGGYRLTRSPDQISVAEIITAIEGPIAITECTTESPVQCDLAAMCAVRANWQTINRVVLSALQGVSLAQMAKPVFLSTPVPVVAAGITDEDEAERTLGSPSIGSKS